LIDVLVALSLFAAAAGFAAKCVGQFARVGQFSEHYRQACTLSADFLEHLTVCAWADITNKTGQVYLQTNVTVNGWPYAIECRIEPFATGEAYSHTLRQMVVEVRWIAEGRQQALPFCKTISRYVGPP
jgi:hypothetical protein